MPAQAGESVASEAERLAGKGHGCLPFRHAGVQDAGENCVKDPRVKPAADVQAADFKPGLDRPALVDGVVRCGENVPGKAFAEHSGRRPAEGVGVHGDVMGQGRAGVGRETGDFAEGPERKDCAHRRFRGGALCSLAQHKHGISLEGEPEEAGTEVPGKVIDSDSA